MKEGQVYRVWMKEGQLYRVNNYAVSEAARHYTANLRIVAEDGYLWIWEGERDGPHPTDGYLCRSLATGELRPFFPDELEAAE